METPPADTADVDSRRGTSTASRRRSATTCAAFLQQKGIATGVHYTPIHLYSCYGNQPHLPQAEAVFQRIVSLPMYPDMTDADIQQVIDSITEYYVTAGFIGSRKATVKLPREEAGQAETHRPA